MASVKSGSASLRRPPNEWATHHPALAAYGIIEAGIGVSMTGFFIIVILGMLSGFVLLMAWQHNQPHLDLRTRIAVTVTWLIVLIFALRSLHRVTKAIQHAWPPVLLSVAGRWLRVRPILRPVVSAWWILLAIASPLTAHYIIGQMTFAHPNPGEALFADVMLFLILFAASVGANINWLIAIAALTANASIVKNAWRFRLLFDLAAALAVYFIHLPPFPALP